MLKGNGSDNGSMEDGAFDRVFDGLFGGDPSAELRTDELDAVAARLQGEGAAPSGYLLRRVILVNYWHFDYLDLVIPHGRLFLLGENGSGKSTILGATLPMLLDGIIRPERLDTFGSTHRRIDHYVLGQSSGGTTYPRRTSVVALEFAQTEGTADDLPTDRELARARRDGSAALDGMDGSVERSDRRFSYLTIGICFAGNVDSSEAVRPYRFVLTDGKRLGIDLPLFDRHRRVYDAAYLRQVFREHGVVAERQAEYQELVARHLFGFRDARALDHLVEVLLLLRRPGLSNELRTFADVYEYLKKALPPLPEEVTQTTTEAFARIDELRHQERRLTRQADSCATIYAADRTLARARTRQRALPVLRTEAEARRRHETVAAKREALARAEQDRADAEVALRSLQAELAGARDALADLEGSARGSEAADLERLRRQAEEDASLRRVLLAERENATRERRQRLAEIERRIVEQTNLFSRRQASARDTLDAMAATARGGFWSAAQDAVAEGRIALDAATLPVAAATASSDDGLVRSIDALGEPFQARAVERRSHLEELERDVSEVEQATAAEEDAQRRLGVRAAEQSAARTRRDEADSALATRWDELARRASRLSTLFHAAVLADAGSAFLDALTARDRERLGTASTAIDAAATARDEEAEARSRPLGREIGRLRATIERAEAGLDLLRRDPDFAPVRSARRQEAREALAGLGLDARPLYAVIDFAPDLSGEQRGAIERALEDAGLLDALVSRSADAASAQFALASRGLADCFIAARSQPGDSVLGKLLVADSALDDPAWRAAAERALGSIAWFDGILVEGIVGGNPWVAANDTLHQDPFLASLGSDGSWSQGLLRGSSGAGGEAGYVGLPNRQARREVEIARRENEIRVLRATVDEREAELEGLRRESAARADALKTMRQIVDDRALAAAEARLQERTNALRQAEAAEAEAATALAAAAERRALLAGRLADRAVALVGVATPDAARVRSALRAIDRLEGSRRAVLGELERLGELWVERRADLTRQVDEESGRAAAEAQVAEAREGIRRAEEALQRILARLESNDLGDFQRQLRAARERVDGLDRRLLDQTQRLGGLGSEVEGLRDGMQESEALASAADDASAAALAALDAILGQNSDVLDAQAGRSIGAVPAASIEAAPDAPIDAAAAARLLVAPEDDPDALGRDAEQARDRRRAVFDEEQRNLVDYNLAILVARDRVIAQRSAQVEQSLAELLRAIQGQIEDTRLLLDAEEERLFKDYLCDTGLNAIHHAVQAAEGLVWRINHLLGRTPLGGERYELRLEPADRDDNASPLARHHALFRKDPLTITEDERRVLFEAVRSAVARAHLRSTEEGEGFPDLLAKAFDYREWYTLHLYVTDPNGRRQRISSRTARARSGGQQLFALYVPLFAALAALYHSAEPWAPRLFAMDEAFDKVSEDNVALLLRFLVELGFQWIVASPRLSGAGREDLPACADWQLCHDQSAQLAQAIPFLYWQGQPS